MNWRNPALQYWNKHPNKRANPVTDRKGLTLLEMVVALAILSVGIVGVLQAYSSAMAANRVAESQSAAADLASSVASELDRQASLESGQLSGEFQDCRGYSWTADIESPDNNGMARVVITVSWKTGSVERDFGMVAYLCPQVSSALAGTSQSSTVITNISGGGG
ncbi:MAG TPA: hypothetical protein DCL60_02740 [Armatimonadetes bacterium]|jgi:general secretion pathway protein I|nr:hypothetical protein [Armatimonadota bacterium]